MIAKRFRNKCLELFRYREMFLGLVERDVRARYKGSLLGFFWSLLNPLLMMAVYQLVFSVYMKVNIPNYALFVFTGLLPWTWFSTALSNATTTILDYGNLIKKVYFPLEILPLVNVTANMVNFLLSLPVLFLFMAFSGMALPGTLVHLPLLVGLQFLLTLGFALILSTLNPFFRDVQQLIQPLLLTWFYITPIIYAESMVPENLRWILLINPFTPLIQSYHRVVLEGLAPDWASLGVGAAFSIGLLAAGYGMFRSMKYTFAEVV